MAIDNGRRTASAEARTVTLRIPTSRRNVVGMSVVPFTSTSASLRSLLKLTANPCDVVPKNSFSKFISPYSIAAARALGRPVGRTRAPESAAASTAFES